MMCTLDGFPPPTLIGERILCECEGLLINDASKHHEHTVAYPVIKIKSDIFRPSISSEISRDVFLNKSPSLWKTVVQVWHEHGFQGILQEFFRNPSHGLSSYVASGIARFLEKSLSWGNSFFWSMYPHLQMSEAEMCEVFSSALNWKEGKLRAFAWHPQTIKCAVALNDDSVHIYNQTSSIIPVLKHKLQKSVMDLAWKPYCSSVLAVACRSGVLLWQVDPTSVVTRPSSNCMTLLFKRGHAPVSSISWHPDGLFLVSVSPVNTSMIVWDISTEVCFPLKRVGGGGLSFVHWAPDGERLFSATPSSLFRVWETQKWTAEKWVSARCQAACWSPDGRVLLLATNDEPLIFSLSFGPSESVSPYAIGGCKSAIPIADLSSTVFEDSNEAFVIGGGIQNMVWDRYGERLAVSFKDNPRVVAIFRTKVTPSLTISPCTLVCGSHNDVVQIIKFHDSFQHGALLTIGWKSGEVQYVPLLFTPSSHWSADHSNHL